MTTKDLIDIVAALVGIVGFVFSIWVWMRSDFKIRELTGVMNTIHRIAAAAILESELIVKESNELRLQQAEKTLGTFSSIREMTSQYAEQRHKNGAETGLGQLIEQRVVWNKAMVMDLETSNGVTEIWLVTPDLKPDASNETTGRLVNKNIKNGKRYIYFFPDNLPHRDAEIARLFKNIGLDGTLAKYRNRVVLVPLSQSEHKDLFDGGNIILYYRDKERFLPPRCFEEVLLTQIPERGAFWQEHAEGKSQEIRHLLETGLQKYTESPKVEKVAS